MRTAGIDPVHRLLVEARRLVVEDDPPVAHPDDPVGVFLGLGHVVDVDKDRQLQLSGEVAQEAHDLLGCLGVERGRRLVRQQDLGVLHQRAHDADALALAARQLVGAGVGVVGDADALHQFVGAADVLLGIAPHDRRPGRDVAQPAGLHVLHHRQAIHEVEALEHHADLAPRRPQVPAAQLRQLGSVELDRARGRLDQTVDAAQQRRLARPGRADDGHDAFALDGQVEVLQDRVSAAVAFDEVGDLQHEMLRCRTGARRRRPDSAIIPRRGLRVCTPRHSRSGSDGSPPTGPRR
ncbi:6-pyruvoyl-tetrahydropterin synthase [Roseivivax marinus]|uniref:6-pyruvoyl-tetrahydropterin synthase n=1 Tax=Roseivivax marinus TaxID=1379903 RepID=W4HFY6_9RHOB|nr:6-pyruvoyl-tetrahydropterin synthase [Roseivivax marinus]